MQEIAKCRKHIIHNTPSLRLNKETLKSVSYLFDRSRCHIEMVVVYARFGLFFQASHQRLTVVRSCHLDTGNNGTDEQGLKRGYRVNIIAPPFP